MSAAEHAEKNLQDVKAWMHYYAPEPLRSKLEVVVAMAERADALQRIADIEPDEWHKGDGWECVAFIQAIAREALVVAAAEEEGGGEA